MDQTYMKEKPVVPLLLSMGIPVIISMIAGALYNMRWCRDALAKEKHGWRTRQHRREYF